MSRKAHLTTAGRGPYCQRGAIGARLHGEHITCTFAELMATPVALHCAKCRNGKLFALLARRAAEVDLAKTFDLEPVVETLEQAVARDRELITRRRAA